MAESGPTTPAGPAHAANVAATSRRSVTSIDTGRRVRDIVRVEVFSSRTSRAAVILALLLCAGGASSSCKKDPPPPKAPAVCTPPPSAEVPVIGLSTTDACPRAKDAKDGRWDAAPVFQVDASEKLPAEMKRLCVYTWSARCTTRSTRSTWA